MATSEAVEVGRVEPSRERPRRRLARRDGKPRYDEEELARFFTLGPEDVGFVAGTRSDRNRLAVALLLTWARAERKLVSDPATLPTEVVGFVARQLQLAPDVLAGYRRRPATRSAHVTKVCRELSVRPFGAEDEQRLSSFVADKVAHTGNSAALVDAAEDWLVREGLLRPAGETTIERLVYAARAEAEGRLFADIAGQLGDEQRQALDALCATDGGDSMLAHLAAPPRAPSAAAVLAECERLVTVRAALVAGVDWHGVTPNRRRQWASGARRLYAQALRRYPAEKRYTLLLAFLTVRVEEITDAVAEMFDALVGRVFSRSDDDLAEARLEQAEAQAEGARMFREVVEIVLDSAVPAEAVREEVFRRIPVERLGELVTPAVPNEGSRSAAAGAPPTVEGRSASAATTTAHARARLLGRAGRLTLVRVPDFEPADLGPAAPTSTSTAWARRRPGGPAGRSPSSGARSVACPKPPPGAEACESNTRRLTTGDAVDTPCIYWHRVNRPGWPMFRARRRVMLAPSAPPALMQRSRRSSASRPAARF